MAKTNWFEITAYISWARLFEENRDTAEKAKTTHKGVLKYLQKYDGEYKADFEPATDKDLEIAQKAMTLELYGGNPRFTPVDDPKGCGVKFQLSRRHNDKQVFKNKDGEEKEFNFGGEPEVVWWNDEQGKGTPWDKNTDGLVGNGSLVKLKFTTYGDTEPTVSDTIRIEKIGVIEHVPYISNHEGF